MREAAESSADELDLERDRARRIKPQAASQSVRSAKPKAVHSKPETPVEAVVDSDEDMWN